MNEFGIECVTAILERTIKRLWILCIVLVILLAGSNVAWFYYESQFEEVVTEEEINSESSTGDATGIMGNNNEVNNGEGNN